MLTDFKNFKLITENPDTITDNNGAIYYCQDPEAMPFFITVNDNHTKVTGLYLGRRGDYHSSVEYHDDYSKRAYPGRVWLDSKIMSFWVYPNEILFKDIIKSLENKLNIKIFNNNWKIEIIKSENKKVVNEFEPNRSNDYYYISNTPWSASRDIIPIEEYVGSEDASEEEKIIHLMSWKEKEFAKQSGKFHFKGIGSYKTGWDQPKNIKFRQALYQEKCITKFENFKLIKESPDDIYINDERIYWNEGKNRPFYIEVNEDHTKVKRLYVGLVDQTHYNMYGVENSKRAYAGRLFLDEKIITFWTYPNPTLFKDIIKKLEIRLRRKIFNNKWRVEVIRMNDNSIKIHEYDPDFDNYYFSSRDDRENDSDIQFEFIPIEEYIGSKDIPEELRIQHLMNWKEKEESKRKGFVRGFGSDKTAWDQPKNIKYRRAIYQENKRY